MSDEEDSISEAFSASEDEWKPSKNIKGYESSDDDDSDFEESAFSGACGGRSHSNVRKERSDSKARGALKQMSKKRTGLSLRSKLYKKYRPPPKILSPSSNTNGKNSSFASTSRTKSKNDDAPNESKNIKRRSSVEDAGSSSDSSIENHLVNFAELDIQSSFFNIESKRSSDSPVRDLSHSDSDSQKCQTKKEESTFNFSNLLDYAKRMESFKEGVAKHNAEEASKKFDVKSTDNMDVYSVLALGEKQHNLSHNDRKYDDDDDDKNDDGVGNETQRKNQCLTLSKSKSTRIKRHLKTRPASSIAANDTEDSDWEEVTDSSKHVTSTATSSDISKTGGNLEILVELPSHKREKKINTQHDIELAFKRRLNRDIKERQVLLHKASLLCRFARTLFFNRLLNNTVLMQKALKLLPSKSAYPAENGTEIKYFQSMVTWFKTVIKLKSQNLYPEKSTSKTKAIFVLLKQIEDKEARSKEDMIFIFITLLRGMGLQCRLVSNMQPLPLKPAQSELQIIKLKTDEICENRKTSASAKSTKKIESCSDNKSVVEQKVATANKEALNQEIPTKQVKHGARSKNAHKSEEYSTKAATSSACKEKQVQNTKPKKVCNDTEIEEKEKKSTTKRVIKEKNSKCDKKEVHPKVSKTVLRSIKSANPESTPQSISNVSSNSKNCSQDNEISLNLEKHDSSYFIPKEKAKKSVMKHTKSAKSKLNDKIENPSIEQKSSQKENKKEIGGNTSLAPLKRAYPKEYDERLEEKPDKIQNIELGSAVPKIVVQCGNDKKTKEVAGTSKQTRNRCKSPQSRIDSGFLIQGSINKQKFSDVKQQNTNIRNKTERSKSPAGKVKISTDFLQHGNKRVLRSRQKTNEVHSDDLISIPQLDGANDDVVDNSKVVKSQNTKTKKTKLKRVKVDCSENSDEDFEPSPPKNTKIAPALSKKNRLVVSSDDENDKIDESPIRKAAAGDLWVEVWCDVEEQWVCMDIFKGKVHCVDIITKSASSPLAYVFAFQNDLSVKDVTARYCSKWATVVRKSRVESAWLDAVTTKYLGHPTMRDIREDQELRRIHEEKPMPTAISDYKNHPFYVLERHLLKFQALYPPNAPSIAYIRGEAVYSRDCVHTLHSREIWLKQARTVKLGEKPYKIVKARPKWDRITQTVIKDQPLEIFGYWQTQEYEPPTAENGLVPRNAYGNVELFKASMLPKKTKHIRLPGLNRICKKLGIDCANAVVGFDFHQGACHPTYDGFVVCEEFEDQVVAAWHKDQEDQERKEEEKYDARVYGNWKKLIRGLLIREKLKLKYNF